MIVAIQLITSFFAAAGFSILFNAPRKMVIPGGIIGMCGWIIHFTLVNSYDFNTLPATGIAAIVAGFLSIISARLFKNPVLIFYVSGIIPLVPGGIAYNAMRSFIENDYYKGVELSVEVMLISGGIALGLILSEVTNQIFTKVTQSQQAG